MKGHRMMAKNVDSRAHKMLIKTRAVLKDKDKKSLTRILKELLITAVKLRCVPSHYFTYLLYRKPVNNYLDYVCNKECSRVHRALHSRDTLDFLDNKVLFHEHFSSRGLSVPRRLSYNLKNRWFLDASTGLKDAEIRTADEFVFLLHELFRHSGCISIFAKPIRGSGGSGVVRITKDILTLPVTVECRRLFNSIAASCYIFQEEIVQHAELKRLNPTSLNTIRINTFVNENNKPEIISSFIRMGISGAVVDNLGAGGLFAGVDMISGRLHEIARNRIEFGGLVCDKHPDTGVVFKDFVIPYFAEVKAMACQAGKLLQDKLTCWDIGIAVNGPVLVEGNGWFHLTAFQIAAEGYRRNPVFLKAMRAAGIHTSE
jgi:hypothetical protein